MTGVILDIQEYNFSGYRSFLLVVEEIENAQFGIFIDAVNYRIRIGDTISWSNLSDDVIWHTENGCIVLAKSRIKEGVPSW